MIKMAEYAKRRKDLMRKIGPDGVVILTAARVCFRNNYHEFPYRQQSDFYYLTGFQEPDAVAVLLPKKNNVEFILFNRVRDRAQEIWDGYRAGQEGAKKIFHADHAYPIQELEQRLPELLEGRKEIHYALGVDKAYDKIILGAVNKLRGKIRSGVQSPIAFMDVRPTIHEMRLIKSPAEIALMRKAAEISARAHIRAMKFCKPGIFEYQLEAEISHELQHHGARFHAYTPIVGSGENTCILHYVSNNHIIKNGSLVLIDAGGEYENYASDITRTFPANGRYTGEQRAIYDIVLDAQTSGIKALKPGAPWNVVQQTATKIITQGLIDLGLLKGRLDDLIEKEAYFDFYMHKSGHWLGLDVHDAGRYKVDDKWRRYQPGMVTTVEPGIYISSDLKGVPKRWHNIGVRIEDDVLITAKGTDVLSKDLPKTTSEIEKIMA